MFFPLTLSHSGDLNASSIQWVIDASSSLDIQNEKGVTKRRREGSEAGSLEKLESLAFEDNVLRCSSQSLSPSAIFTKTLCKKHEEIG
ncbi:hypothetical protein L2E82_43990 [Cichorium intybus]|uniref:Uncharacterized protein n=1 Tax=Cichorium intybus TaxID=13427 RepID=A0ACB8ZPU1_CICIN|nr:hypothetical protein L2E82_43990 [Cichorium intybus]